MLGMTMFQRHIGSIIHNCKKLLSQRMLSMMNQVWEHRTWRRKKLIKYCKKRLVVLVLEDPEDEYLVNQGGSLLLMMINMKLMDHYYIPKNVHHMKKSTPCKLVSHHLNRLTTHKIIHRILNNLFHLSNNHNL